MTSPLEMQSPCQLLQTLQTLQANSLRALVPKYKKNSLIFKTPPTNLKWHICLRESMTSQDPNWVMLVIE